MESMTVFLENRAKLGLLRKLTPVEGRGPGRVVIGGRKYLDFSSNDYLGLSGHPKLIAAAKKALDEFGLSSGGSRLMSGSLGLHHELEEKLAGFRQKEAALVFNSGYQANVGIISGLYGKADAVFCDRLSHASLIDGILLSGARLFRFQHNDAGHLGSLLEKHRPKFKKALIVTESIFSMDGDRPPLSDYVGLKEEFDCALMVDEAHATGLFGAGAGGVVEEEGLCAKVDLIMGTFSKALAGFGAYLAASKTTIDFLVNVCRGFIYSTALPPAVIAANIAALEVAMQEPFRRQSVLDSALYFRRGLSQKGFSVRGDSQIIPVILGEAGRALEFSARLKEKGYWVLAVRPPTVPRNQARLRFSLTFSHTRDILRRLIDDICQVRV